MKMSRLPFENSKEDRDNYYTGEDMEEKRTKIREVK
jgi:hypothetical protein